MLICGHEYTLYIDYDRGYFHLLDFYGKLEYMRGRVDRDLVLPCRFLLQNQDCIAVGLLVPGLVCAGISAAATFPPGSQAARVQDRNIFVQFVRRYMHADLQHPLVDPRKPNRPRTYVDWLYEDIRCGLSHGFALEWGHIENLGPYVGLAASGQPQINQNELLEDFVRGWHSYLGEVSLNPAANLAQDFEKRFHEVFHD